jgi:hypothetical protein
MTELKAVPLKTLPEIDREKVEKLIGELVELHRQGHVHEIAFFYVDEKGSYFVGVSGNMTIRNLSMGIAYLQHRLFEYMSQKDRETPPAA